MSKRKLSRLRNSIEEKHGFTVTCSVQSVCDGEEDEWDGCKTIDDVEKQMIADGWLNDLIIEDSINLCCPRCADYLKENVSDFEELDARVGGKAKD